MRKLFSLLFVFLLVFPVTACGQSKGEESGTEIIPVTDAAESAQETKTASDAADSGAETEEKTNRKAEFDFETKTVMLNSGYEMPVGGLGTYSLHGDECMNSVKSALSNGVRLIDTASAYGVVVIPGSSNPDHIRENTELYHFSLTEDEMARIGALDRNEKHDWY